MKVSTTEEYERMRQAVEAYFVESNRLADSHKSITSPSGKYILDIDGYSTKPGSWTYSRGSVRRFGDSRLIADVKRNYGHFPYCWIEHPNSNEYLICGEDYQGYTIINLTQEVVQNYLPPEGLTGGAFCWVAYYPSPDNLILAVEGCIWAAPFEIRFYDLSNPDSLPLLQLAWIDDLVKVIGWETNDTFVAPYGYYMRKLDGVRYDDLSEEEQYELDRNALLLSYDNETIRWHRPRDIANKDNG